MSTSNNNTTVVYSIDANGYEAGVNKIKSGAATISASQEALAKKAALVDAAMKEAAANGFELNARAANKLAAEYLRLADTVGKTQAQILAQKTANTGATNTFAGLQAQIDAAGKSTHGFSLETSAAKRELLVLAHELSQGNYKKFGGSLLVLGEQTGAAGLLFSAAGVSALALAGAVAGAAYQVVQGVEQFNAFNKAISATGGFIGLSAAQMEDLSAGLLGTGQNLTAVHEAMAQVAATGAFTADNLRLATVAALDMASDIGIGTDKAAESLAKIQDNVIEWMTKYQQAHHTFSAAQVEEIENFVKQGDTASAVKAIMLDLASAHDKIAADADKNMGSVLNWWHAWGDIIARVKAGILGIGVPDSMTKQIGDQMERVAAAQKNITDQQALGLHGNVALAQQQLTTETKKLGVLRDQQAITFQSQKKQQESATGGDVAVRAHSFIDDKKYANPADKHQLELDDNAKSFAKATKDLDKNGSLYAEALKRNNDNIAQINAEYAKKTKTHTPSNNGVINAQLADLAAQNKLIEQEEKRSEVALKAQRDSGLIDNEQYLIALNGLQTAALNKEIALAQQRADVAGGKKEQAARNTALGQVKELTAQRDALDTQLTDNLETLAQRRAANVEKYSLQEANTLRKQQDAYTSAFATRFLTSDQKADYDARYKLLQDYENQVAALKQQYESPTADKKELASKLAIAAQGFADEKTLLETNLAQQQAIRESYGDQFKHSLVTLAGNAQTNAQLAASAFTTAWGDASNALDTFVTTGKLNFSSLTASILGDLAKIALHAAESQIFSSIASSSFFSAGGSVGHFATGGSISGPGTGTSDSIPAMLSDGEYVVNAASTKKYGSLLESINSGRMSHYASGGAVGSVPASPGPNSTHLSLSLGAANSGLTQEDLAALAPQIQNLVDKRMAQRMTGQGGFADRIRQRQI